MPLKVAKPLALGKKRHLIAIPAELSERIFGLSKTLGMSLSQTAKYLMLKGLEHSISVESSASVARTLQGMYLEMERDADAVRVSEAKKSEKPRAGIVTPARRDKNVRTGSSRS